MLELGKTQLYPFKRKSPEASPFPPYPGFQTLVPAHLQNGGNNSKCNVLIIWQKMLTSRPDLFVVCHDYRAIC